MTCILDNNILRLIIKIDKISHNDKFKERAVTVGVSRL